MLGFAGARQGDSHSFRRTHLKASKRRRSRQVAAHFEQDEAFEPLPAFRAEGPFSRRVGWQSPQLLPSAYEANILEPLVSAGEAKPRIDGKARP